MNPPGKGVFITGTDTEAGKTIAAAAVLVSMRASGIDAVPMKPVQTGGRWDPRPGPALSSTAPLRTNGETAGRPDIELQSPDLTFCLRWLNCGQTPTNCTIWSLSSTSPRVRLT